MKLLGRCVKKGITRIWRFEFYRVAYYAPVDKSVEYTRPGCGCHMLSVCGYGFTYMAGNKDGDDDCYQQWLEL